MKNLAELLASLRQPHHDREDAVGLDRCLACDADLTDAEAYATFRVCPACGFHYNVGARRRIALLVDSDSFRETNRSYIALDPISFAKEYRRRVVEEQRRTGLPDAIVTGTARIGGQPCTLAVIDFRFLGGTIGSVVGEKLALAFESAARKRRPLVVVVSGGGARLQEGPLALAQLAKIAAAQRRLAAARTPFICVLANPTTGAAYAGFASLADYVVAEPGALVGYATMRAATAVAGGRLPLDAHTAEGQLRDGMIDAVVERPKHRDLISGLLGLFSARSRVKSAEEEEGQGTEPVETQAWQEVQLARHADRPSARDYIARLTTSFIELRGDRVTGDDAAVVCGIGLFNGDAVMFIGQQSEMAQAETPMYVRPEGFRKARRAMQLAGRFSLPVVTLVDTPGAYPGVDAEARGLGHAIATCTATLADLPTPSVAVVIGEGGGEAALALSVADRVLMLEHATFSVTSPERAAEVFYRDAAKVEAAATALRLTAESARDLKVVDHIVREPAGGAHADHDAAAARVSAALVRALAELHGTPVKKLVQQRYRKYRALGGRSGYITTTVAQDLGDLGKLIGRRAGSAVKAIRRRPAPQPERADENEQVLV